MKRVQSCSKCGSAEIVRVPGEMTGFGGGNYIRVGVTWLSNIPVSRYVCTSCGFVEEWGENQLALGSVKKKWGAEEKP